MTSKLFHNLSSLTLKLGQRAVVITGGLRKEEKVRLINQRFGVQVDWFEIDGVESSSPRAIESIAARIRSGRVGAVVFLNGQMAHKDWNVLVSACNQVGVVYANADRGGIGSIERAFQEIERRLAPR
jgi:hypothetical protein